MAFERRKALRDFIRSVYLQPEYIELYDQALEGIAIAENKQIKKGRDWEKAVKWIMSNKFIDSLQEKFKSLSIDDLKTLTEFHNSEAMKKFRKCKKIRDFSQELQEALYKELIT